MQFTVQGMTCDHCIRAITAAVLRRDLGARVNVDLAAGEVRVEGRLSQAEAVAAIEEEGYAVVNAPMPAAPAIASASCCGSCHS
ncbi:heavy-metal-associated domain-containing protein [Lysobacter cavernae]|uniref:Heavy-metal-associated domain-containing protein n=1 Tax=Lysobacter cavernae TaxID=1685901 RepID=A0ABV7RMR4_9GAMM